MYRYIILICQITLISLCMCGCDNGNVKFIESTVTASSEELDESSDIEDISNKEEVSSKEDVDITNTYLVYVCGAVNEPGVYELESSSIKQDALILAGGLIEGASTTYVNLAEPICDGEQIYFPLEEELEQSYNPLYEEENNSSNSGGLVNINTASKDVLMSISGIGESKATDIIAYRESNGEFLTIEDIMNVPGIKEGMFNKMKDFITVN